MPLIIGKTESQQKTYHVIAVVASLALIVVGIIAMLKQSKWAMGTVIGFAIVHSLIAVWMHIGFYKDAS